MEQLRQHEFGHHVEKGTLRLAFVGMSNVGKSRRAEALARDCGFFHHNVDTHIAHDLGLKSVQEIGEWLGYPNTEGYAQREKQYLDLEHKHTNLGTLDTGGKNLVFDTTGSVVYLPDETIAWLRDNTLIVYLSVDDTDMEEMMERFFANIKPLVWGDKFSKKEGQQVGEAIRDSYPLLLQYRAEKYTTLSHLTISASLFWNASGQETLNIIKQNLPV